MATLFEPYQLGNISLRNRMVMSPMTRNRASADHIPTHIMPVYYEQRASAGLIITEGTAPSPNATGYPRIPGVYNNQQVEEWKKVTERVHNKGGKIIMQLMHTGRVGHPDNLPEGAKVVAPSAITPQNTTMYVDGKGMEEIPAPHEMTREDIATATRDFVKSAQNAIQAGFDGVELHGANGYLMEQFLYPGSNERTDEYGGSIENRARFVLETTKAVSDAIGKDKVGIRLSPQGAFNDVMPYEGAEEMYDYLSQELDKLDILYIHTVDHSAMGAPEVPQQIKNTIRKNFSNTIILSGGYDKARAAADLADNKGDLVAFGRPFLANPDLVERFKQDAPLNNPDYDTFYTPGEKGYIDYPLMGDA